MLREVSFSYFFFIILDLIISKCPEIRKPHPTNCSLFYNCVNLPSGEYVWIPSKCSEGLMFESYLGICVLPSETWTCDTNFQKKRNTSELIKSSLNQSSDNINFSETLDSSYTLDTIFNEDINPVTRNSSKRKFPTFEINENPINLRIEEENPSDKNLIDSNNFTKFEKKIIVNNIVLLNYFITNYIIRNIDENQKVKENETKYEIANSIQNIKEKVKIDDMNQLINRLVNNESNTETTNFYRKTENNNFVINSPKIETKNICKTMGNVADPNSTFHYYLCYSNNEKTKNLTSVRMMCPKNLIFCAEKKICTRQRICRKKFVKQD